jgi:hypothetical protein
MVGLRIFLKRFILKLTKKIIRRKKYGMNTDSLTIWSPIWSNQKVDMFGPVKIMTVMFKAIVLLKVIFSSI